jgi:hypothetical protein
VNSNTTYQQAPQNGTGQAPPPQQYVPQQQQFQQQAPSQQYQQGASPTGQQQGHNCAHGVMQFIPAGTNRNSGEAYGAYWKCPLPRGTQGRCRNVYAS